MTWRPFLTGDLLDRARASLAAIVDDRRYELDGDRDPSLGNGNAGVALLDGYLFLTTFRPDAAAAAARRLASAVSVMAEQPADASLYGGLAGVGWVTAHLQDRLPNFDADDDLVEIDRAILDHLAAPTWTADYDLVSGLVGLGVYALERLPRSAARNCLKLILAHLVETAEHQGGGITWWTDPKLLPPRQREQCPRGYYNLGAAHGIPGIVAFLGQCCSAGIDTGRSRDLLTRALRWLRNQETPGGFPAWVAPDEPARPARLAWCYGDPGAALTQLAAGRAAGEPGWERDALAVVRRSCRRAPIDSGVVDTGLCHGAAGLAHLYNRAFQATGDPSLADAARFWFERTLAMCHPGRGIGGFAAWHPAKDSEAEWIAERGFLTGSTGIALALIAATTDVEPLWDRVLLTNVPPQVPKG